MGSRRGDVWEAADLMQQMRHEGVQPDIHTYTSFINVCCKAGDMLRAMKNSSRDEALGVKPNVKTYTTLIHGWGRASLPEKSLKCFEEMKLAGLKPDKAVYHCLITSLLSQATVAEDYIYTEIMRICEETVECGLMVDMGTAVHWSKCLRKIETTGGGSPLEDFPSRLEFAQYS
ncbi:pentatricopeptide repeat-containing At5g04810, chloroplastic [Olea europaea subsp. europaea]|uniref:Pentatricopeptide repeat-containing At5g04810, chloroplastic n=1 Tax=Olea europaea subsp. europaea TaxID=158383 RepID=A0A8S0SB01_OLEEU|nr:pentatricopeptide repeat-containing At5g04810, chloroplastic [Olea europaea subsp. europaea]